MRATAPLRSRVLMRPEGARSDPKKIGVVADDEDVVVFHQAADQVLELLHPGFGGQTFGYLDFAVVAGLSADQRCGLERALERAGDDAVELDIESAEKDADEDALLLAFFVEGPFYIDLGVGAARARAGMAKNVEIHGWNAGSVLQSSVGEALT